MWSGWRDYYFSIDLRSLGLFRILLAGILIGDWWGRWPHLLAFYTADGVLPAVALAGTHGSFHFELLSRVGSLGTMRLIFLAGLLCYAFFLVGWRTHVFHVASCVFHAAILQRNQLIQHSGDNVLLILLFWSLFLPLGSRFSVDAARRALRQAGGAALEDLRAALAARTLHSTATLAALFIVLQIGLVYFTAAVAQSGAAWHEGTALYYALHQDQFATSLGVWLRHQPLWLLRLLTWVTLGLEYAALPLLLLPWGRPWVRRSTLLALACMQAGFALTLATPTFSAAMLASSALLLSTPDWSAIERWGLWASRPVRAYYDDTCGICRRCARLLVLADRAGNIHFVGSSDRAAHPDDIPPHELDTSLVAVDVASRKRSRRAGAVAAVFRALPLPFHIVRFLALPGLSALTGFAYDWVAHNRGRLSRWCGEGVCGAPGSRTIAGSVMTAPAQSFGRRLRVWLASFTVLLIFSATLVGAWNLSLTRRFGWQPLRQPAWMAAVVEPLSLQRGWSMFEPEPLRFDGWWVLAGETYRGEHVDPLTDASPVWSKPPQAERRCDIFWRLYLTKLCLPENSEYRAWFGRYLTRESQREKRAAEQLRAFDFWYVREATQPPGTPEPFPTQRILLWRYDCVGGRVLPVGE